MSQRFGMNTMTRHDYKTALSKLSLPYGAIFFSIVIPGVLGSLYVADRIASVSSWPREMVFLAMLPTFLMPVLLGGWLISIADRRLGLKCHSCDESLSIGKHVSRLLECGGACPKCGVLVVDLTEHAEPGVAQNGGPAMPSGNSRVVEDRHR